MGWASTYGSTCLLLVSCSAADPGVDGLTRGEFKDSGGSPSDSSLPPTDGAIKDGAGEGGDSSSDATSMTTAFTGAGAYASNKPATTAVQFHTMNMVGVTPGKGVDCLSCHKMGGAGPAFLFAGTIFQDMTGTTPATDEEIRVRGSDGKAFSAHSDNDGNFWYLPGTGEAVAFPAQSGARDGTQMALMMGNLAASSCNATGCHDGTMQAFIHIP